MKKANGSTSTEELALMLKGVYERVARELGVEPYFVSRAARGELNSPVVEAKLERELKKVLARADGRKTPVSKKANGAGRKRAKAATKRTRRQKVLAASDYQSMPAA